jgi:hypothetical protein
MRRSEAFTSKASSRFSHAQRTLRRGRSLPRGGQVQGHSIHGVGERREAPAGWLAVGSAASVAQACSGCDRPGGGSALSWENSGGPARTEPGTSSLSGTFAGCVQAGGARDHQVMGGATLTVVVR